MIELSRSETIAIIGKLSTAVHKSSLVRNNKFLPERLHRLINRCAVSKAKFFFISTIFFLTIEEVVTMKCCSRHLQKKNFGSSDNKKIHRCLGVRSGVHKKRPANGLKGGQRNDRTS